MVVTVVGKSQVDFIAKDGSNIKGTNLFVNHLDEHVDGLKAEKFFIKASIDCSDIKAGDTIDILFNQKGKVDTIRKSNK